MSNLRDCYKKLTTSVVVNRPVTSDEMKLVTKENVQASEIRKAQREERRRQRNAVRGIKRGNP